MKDKSVASLASIYRVFFEIGCLSFGGGLVSWIHREVVNRRGWMEDGEFLSGVALSQILPGVNSVNVSVFVGQRLRGIIGATVAALAMLTGPFVAVVAAAAVYPWLLAMPGFSAVALGVACVAIGMLLSFGLQAGRIAARGPVSLAVVAVTFVAVGVLQAPMVLVVAVIAPISIFACWPRDEPTSLDHA